MKVDSKIKENLIYLDKILELLINSSPNYSLTLSQLSKKLSGRPLDKKLQEQSTGYFFTLVSNDNKPFQIQISNTLQAEYLKLVEALYFLESEGYINLDYELNMKITYKGILKFSRSFLAEHKQNESDRLLNKIHIYITIGTGILGVIIGLLI